MTQRMPKMFQRTPRKTLAAMARQLPRTRPRRADRAPLAAVQAVALAPARDRLAAHLVPTRTTAAALEAALAAGRIGRVRPAPNLRPNNAGRPSAHFVYESIYLLCSPSMYK